MLKKVSTFLAALILSLGLLIAVPAEAGTKELTFTWEQLLTPDFAGWTLYYSTAADGTYTQLVDIPFEGSTEAEYTSTETLDSPDGLTIIYYFYLTAKDDKGNESDPSNIVSVEIDFEAPNAPFTLKVTVKNVPAGS